MSILSSFLRRIGLLPKKRVAPPPPPPPVRRLPVVGVGSHSLKASELDLLDLLGVKHVRHTIYAYLPLVTYIQPVRAAIARGFKLLIVVHGVEHMTEEEWREWWTRALEALPDVDAWQIGNEHPFFADMPTHCRWHQIAFEVIDQAVVGGERVASRVVTMDLSNAEYRGKFFEYAPDCHAFAVHAYEYPVGPQIERLAATIQHTYRELWITEFGIQQVSIPADHAEGSGGWENVQAAQWTEALTTAGRAGYARAYGYQLRTFLPETHGIVRESDGSSRPAFHALRDYVKAR